MTVGSGNYKYELVKDWAKIPEYFVLDDPVDLAIDSRDRVYVGSRGNHPLLIFDQDGNFVSCWGEGYFVDPHGVFIGPDDSVYVTDCETHTVEKLTLGGELLDMRLGIRNRAAVIFTQTPFNKPTSLSIGPKSNMFVCDGYGNFLIHKFSPNGKLLKTWGGCGNEPGQFAVPHKLDVDKYGTVYVCDRNNDRIQLFDSDGNFINMWTDFHWPQDICISRKEDTAYVVEATWDPLSQPRVTIRDLEGKILSEWGGRQSEGKGILEFTHSVCIDSRGDIYIGEIAKTKRIQKFVKVS